MIKNSARNSHPLSRFPRGWRAARPADKIHASGWAWGYCSAVTKDGWRWIVDAHREGRRYIVHSNELLSAFLELEQTLL